MDFKSLTGKLSGLAGKATLLAGKAMDTTLVALEKTADFSYDKIKSTPYYLKSGEDFDALRSEKNLVIIVIGDREDATTKKVLARLPVLVPRAWQYTATLRILYAADLPDLAKALDVAPGNTLIYRNGTLKTKLSGEKMSEFLLSFDILSDPVPSADTTPPKKADTPSTPSTL